MGILEKIMEGEFDKGNAVELHLTSLGDKQFKLQVCPIMGSIEESASDKAKLLHAALSMPMTVKGTIADIESSIVKHVEQFNEPRTEWQNQVALINARLDLDCVQSKSETKPKHEAIAKKTAAKSTKKTTGKTKAKVTAEPAKRRGRPRKDEAANG